MAVLTHRIWKRGLFVLCQLLLIACLVVLLLLPVWLYQQVVLLGPSGYIDFFFRQYQLSRTVARMRALDLPVLQESSPAGYYSERVGDRQIAALVAESGTLVVLIQTRDNGHVASYGYVYFSDPPDSSMIGPSYNYPDTKEVHHIGWFVKKRLTKNWYAVYHNLN